MKNTAAPKARSSLWQAIFSRKMLACVCTGIASGLPLYVLISLVPYWLRASDVDLKTIGLMTGVGLAYSFKFVWSPLLDRYRMPLLGRRKGWMILTQILLLASIAGFGFFNPAEEGALQWIVWLAVAVAFFSATQDIALDAFRREYLSDEELGLGNSIHVNAYRISGLIPGSLALILSDHIAWQLVYIITAAFMGVGLVMAILVKEPDTPAGAPQKLLDAIVDPFMEFFTRRGAAWALGILGFMILYKLGDNMATALATPFYKDLGFSGTEIGIVAKNAALWPSIIGAMIGGIVMLKIGINKSLWIFGAIQWATIFGFVWLSASGCAPDTPDCTPDSVLGLSILSESGDQNMLILAIVLCMEYLGVGLGTAAFTAFIARTTDRRYTATQFALLTALAVTPRTLAGMSSGFLVEQMGWTSFFWLCALLAVPGMLMLLKIAPWKESPIQ
jgi:PAT family beta-lactamase induction signal transducer AmpG